MAELVKCPTCGRRPSERHGPKPIPREFQGTVLLAGYTWGCQDPLHDLADRAPSLRRDALEEALTAVLSESTWELGLQKIRALLAKETTINNQKEPT